MIYDIVSKLAKDNGTSVTSLCRELMGSTGSLPTWKKDVFRADIIVQLCKRFNVSADVLLGLKSADDANMDDVAGLVEGYRSLDEDGKTIVQSAVILEKRRLSMSLAEL